MTTTNTNPLEPMLLTRAEVARLLSTSDRHVRRLTETGRLPAVRLGGKVRIHQRQLDDFIARLCLTNVSEDRDDAGQHETSIDETPPSPGPVAPRPVIGK